MEAPVFLAHAGEEILYVMLPVLVFLSIHLIRTRRSAREDRAGDGTCLYCGAHLPARLDRCPNCGFKARRGPIGGDRPLESSGPAPGRER